MKFPYKKLIVVGCGGAGKSTFARDAGGRFCLPVVHLDKLWWLPNWIERGCKEFDALLLKELKKPAWIMDGNFSRTLAVRLEACDAAVFLDVSPEICIKSVYERAEAYRGRTRPDMTEGCEETVDEEFKEWIMHYRDRVRDNMLFALEESGKPYYVFDSREKAYAWLDQFTK